MPACRTYPIDNYRNKSANRKITHRRHRMKHAALIILLAGIAGIAAGTARAGYLTGDPRKCPVANPRYCAQTAAVATVRTVMAKRKGITKWNDYLSCQPRYGNLLQWKCSHFDSGHNADTISVVFRATSSGWKRVVTVTANP
jgi:hypothetical protein